MSKDRPAKPEFSRPIDGEKLGIAAETHEIVATATERAALARRFALLALDRLAATLRLVRQEGGVVRVEGILHARAVQSCVVTLAPVAAEIEETFTQFYARDLMPHGRNEVMGPFEDEAWPEPMAGGAIDLGEAVAQQLVLALDPYPRAPGATLERAGAAGGGEAAARPFASLARLMRRH